MAAIESAHTAQKLKIAVVRRGRRGRAKNVVWTWQELAEKLFDPVRDNQHTLEEYLKLPVNEQNDLKDVGAFVGGHFKDGVRKGANLACRSVVTLDVDQATTEQADLIYMGLAGIALYEHVCTSTRKHSPDKPRLRITLPMTREVSIDEYGPLSRIIASMLFPSVQQSMDAVDDVSYRPPQIMYWTSVCRDAEFIAHHNRGPLLDPDEVLQKFGDWQDWTQLPYSEKSSKHRPSTAKKAEDPTTKRGIVGAFCRAYDVPAAIDKFLADIYTPGDEFSGKPRYTYVLGSSSNGLVVHDEGMFGYSHHGTDPCADRLVNSFDMVRLHLFGELDKGCPQDAAATALPSFKAMREFAAGDSEVLGAYLEPDVLEAFEDLGEEQNLGEAERQDADEDLLGPAPKRKQKPLDLMNARHAVAMHGGKTVILTFRKDGSLDYGTPTDLAHLYANWRVATARADEPISNWWMRQTKRRTYTGGVTFAPGKDDPRKYNLWQGFRVRPNPESSCKLFLQHIMNVVCAGNKAHYLFVIGWMAHMIQRPEEKPGVALVLKGLQGTGKDTVGDYLAALLGKHRVKVSQMEHLTGKFNAHHTIALLMHVEEAIWAGDKSAVGPLKSLITSPTAMIERKGHDPIEFPSVMRVLITSNEQWTVPAAADDRRFAVFEVSDIHRRDTAYFGKIIAERENGGAGALLHFLQNYDLTGFDVRAIPKTKGLTNEKLAGLKGVDRWWYEVLAAGAIPQEPTDFENQADDLDWSEGPVMARSEELHAAYEQWFRKHRYQGEWQCERSFGHAIGRMCPSRKRTRLGTKKNRQYHLIFPKLAEARREFEQALAGAVDWDDDEGDELSP
jgi:hypothetical protein